MSDCIFCKIISGELPSKSVYQDKDVMVINDIHPQAPVHLLVIPKKHVAEFIEADKKLVAAVMGVVKNIIKDQSLSGYRLVTNGKGAALIDHLHVHVLGNVDKYRKL
ncbi:HIT domain-containing protein [Candidatus Gottesmanbacteria bacterium]|nr:HIT domain-containing protein [Candidatus Gottesmanbacteria bacterium]